MGRRANPRRKKARRQPPRTARTARMAKTRSRRMTRRRGPPEAPPRAVSRAPAPPPPAAGCGRSPVGYPFSPRVDSCCIRGSPVSGSRVQGSRGQSVRPPVALLGTNSWVFARAGRRGLARRGPRPRVRTSATALRVPRATCRAIIVDVAAPTPWRARECPVRSGHARLFSRDRVGNWLEKGPRTFIFFRLSPR